MYWREISCSLNFRRSGLTLLVLMAAGLMVFLVGCTKEKEIIRYVTPPGAVSLVYPPADSFVTVNNPTFVWHLLAGAARYQIHVSRTSDFISKTIDAQTTDTSYTTVSSIANSTYFWRVRGRNTDGIWGDWSDAEIRVFYKSDYVNYIYPVSQMYTYGIPQDVFVRHDTAFVADGQADLTLVDVSNRANPIIIRNYDPRTDDFAQGVYICPLDTIPYVFVADLDGKIDAINVRDTTFLTSPRLGSSQNLEDLTGVVRPDTLYPFWLITVSSLSQRYVTFNPIYYSPDPGIGEHRYDRQLPADGMGVCVDSECAYIACSTAGLILFDIRDIYNSIELSIARLPGGDALSVDVKGSYAYVSADRGGLFVVDVSNRYNPVVVSEVNTSGRSKDVQVVGNYAFVADASGGLKVIDVTVPDSAHFVAAYTTPYAYGLWADTGYVYVCDRDEGLMIFENRISK